MKAFLKQTKVFKQAGVYFSWYKTCISFKWLVETGTFLSGLFGFAQAIK
jgi:hypothetical protein